MFVSEDITKSELAANILFGIRVRNIDMSINMLSIFFILVFGLFNVFNMIAELFVKGRKGIYNSRQITQKFSRRLVWEKE